jgi:hypothetical protein
MDVAEDRHPPRGLLLTGLALVLAGPGLHLVRTATHHLESPWPAPILSTVGLALVILAISRRRSRGELIVATLATLLTAAVWLYVAVALRLPAYDGPIRPGHRLPEFLALRSDGRAFGLEELKRSPSALVFYRHW